jgi:quercetin dioxygenase-like cupin family protein
MNGELIMQRILLILTGFLIIGGLLTTATLAQPGASAQTVPLKPLERFDGTIVVGTREIHVLIRNWVIPNGQQIPQFPHEGFMVAQLRAGTLITVIHDERQERHEGEFWTVPAGSSMVVETGEDAAILQTMIAEESGVIE